MAPLHRTLLALASLSSLANALCVPRDLWNLKASPTLPLAQIANTGPTPLPTPSTDPKYIVLGLGFQNYTCSASSSTYIQSTIQAGAIADLYDITNTASSSPGDTTTKRSLQAFETCLQLTKCSPSLSNNYCDTCHSISRAAPLLLSSSPHVGTHYFDQIHSTQLPNFALPALQNAFLSAEKAAGVKAPSTAYPGANALGAVDWLYLVDNHSGRTTTGVVRSVYRVETAGGVAPGTCRVGGEVLQVPYAAEYWFYD